MNQKIESAQIMGDNEFEKAMLSVRNEIAVSLLNEYIPNIKMQIVENSYNKTVKEKMYHEEFDENIVRFFQNFFKANSIEINSITSKKINPDGLGYIISVLTTSGIKVTVEYIKESKNRQCHLRILTIYIPEKLRMCGLSKMIINNLFIYSKKTGAELSIGQVINKDWENYLITKGAKIIESDEDKGDTLLIQNMLDMN